MAHIILKKGREKSVNNRHPWIYSGAIGRLVGQPANGETVVVGDNQGKFLAHGIFNRHSQIRVRLLSWQPTDTIGPQFWHDRLQRAIAGRHHLGAAETTTAYRLVHAEADGLPGLIVDRYGGWLVVQFLSLAVEQHRETIVQTLINLIKPQGIYERSDVDVRRKEGLSLKSGLIAGDRPPEWVEIIENGHRFLVDIKQGHKTGFYLDQRENRHQATAYCATGEILNGFAYTGGFAVYAASVGAGCIVNVDTSASALEAAARNMALNGYGDRPDEYITADVFDQLRTYHQQGRLFEVVILDPPKFAHTKRQVEKASRAYKDINLLGMKLLRPGGVLITFSCSGMVSTDLFQKILFGAAVDADREAQIIDRLAQGSDHPVLLTCPESDYLKGFVCRVW